MVDCENLGFLYVHRRGRLGFVLRLVFGLWFGFVVLRPVAGLRPLKERNRSWGDEVSIGFDMYNFYWVIKCGLVF